MERVGFWKADGDRHGLLVNRNGGSYLSGAKGDFDCERLVVG